MILHHLTTTLLLVFSFVSNHTRVGSSILLLHDSSDVFLESAKVRVWSLF
jgi:ceramide synthetase